MNNPSKSQPRNKPWSLVKDHKFYTLITLKLNRIVTFKPISYTVNGLLTQKLAFFIASTIPELTC